MIERELGDGNDDDDNNDDGEEEEERDEEEGGEDVDAWLDEWTARDL